MRREPLGSMLRLMGMRAFSGWSFVLVMLAAGCSADGAAGSAAPPTDRASEPPRRTASCAATEASPQPGPNSPDFSNIVYWDGVRFIASEGTNDDAFGAVVGRVKCTISGSSTPADYELRDGDATYVRAGDALHQVADRPTSEALGAYVGGQAYIFVTVPELRARNVGRCTVPLTEACPS
jgi:hypothetical protein